MRYGELAASASAAETVQRDEIRANNLLPGNRNLARIRKAPLRERASVALGGMFGPHVRELTYCLAEGVKYGTIDGGVAKLILARVLSSAKPVQLDMPVIRTALDLIEAEKKIAAGINDGKISPAEALQLQAWANNAYRSRRVANASMGKR